MALSQKHVGKFLVPWFCKSEWLNVYEKLYGNKSNKKSKQEALEVLYVWKSRTPLLPCGVEGTFIILEAMLLDQSLYNDYNLKLLLSSSVMRFLNLCASYNKNQATFLKSAREMKLPDWLINLRHDTAHAQHLSSLDILHQALAYSYEWLQREYWKPVSIDLNDFINSVEMIEKDEYQHLKLKLESLLSNYCYINLITHSHWNYKTFGDIGDEEVRNALLEELSSLKDVQTITKNTKIIRVLKILWKNLESVLKEFDDVQYRNNLFIKLLLEEDVFLGSFDERDSVLKNEENETEITPEFLYLWEFLLCYLHKNKMIDVLITQLVLLLTKSSESEERKLIAALWLAEIGNAMSKCKFLQEMFQPSGREIFGNLTEEGKSEMLEENCSSLLNLDYSNDFPKIFQDTTKLKALILDKPNKYTPYFISSFLNTNDELKENKKEILKLLEVFNEPKTNVSNKSGIYTLEDLMSKMDTKEIHTTVQSESKRWRKATETDFSKCPIGILPWQSSKINPLL